MYKGVGKMSKNQYNLTFKFFDTEEEAKKFMKARGRRKQTMTQWQSTDGKEHKKIVWYYEK
jgi:hypothetical protein